MLKANDFGLYDTHGNVWEWVWDRYGPYPNNTVTNPIGPNRSTSCGNTGDARVRRGGSLVNDARSLRVAFRNCLNPGDSRSHIGFRLVRTVQPLPDFKISDSTISSKSDEASEPVIPSESPVKVEKKQTKKTNVETERPGPPPLT